MHYEPNSPRIVSVVEDNVGLQGEFTAVSGTPAFGTLYAMTLAGDATMLDERYDATGAKWITVWVGQASMVPNEEPKMVRMKAAARKYEAILGRYEGDWEETWWREAIQNAVDAGATQIDCSVEEMPDGQMKVSCVDNGSGMSKEVLYDAFLVEAGTTKGYESTGGFGMAKELLFVAWGYWEVHTRNMLVTGRNDMHQEEPTEAPYLQGTRLTAVMPADKYTSIAHAMAYVQKCYLPYIRVTMNGNPFTETKLAHGDEIDSFEEDGEVWSRLYYAKGQKRDAHDTTLAGRILVRAKSTREDKYLYMFYVWGAEKVKGQLILEIVGDTKKLLTDNRQGFSSYRTRQQISNKVSQLASDTSSGLRKKEKKDREKDFPFQGTGKLRADVRDKQKIMAAACAETLGNVGGMEPQGKQVGKTAREFSPEQVQQVIEAMKNFADTEDLVEASEGADPGDLQLRVTVDIAEILMKALAPRGPTDVQNIVKQMAWEPDFILRRENDEWHIPKRFYPETMSSPVRKLARYWAEMCRFVMMLLGSGKPFGVGFVFDDGSQHPEGSYKVAAYYNRNGEEWLLLNPFAHPRENDDLLKLSSQDDLNQLFASAVHECTHMVNDAHDHDESFAAALTGNVAKTAGRTREIAQIKKLVLKVERATKARLEAAKPPKEERAPRIPKSKLVGGKVLAAKRLVAQHPRWDDLWHQPNMSIYAAVIKEDADPGTTSAKTLRLDVLVSVDAEYTWKKYVYRDYYKYLIQLEGKDLKKYAVEDVLNPLDSAYSKYDESLFDAAKENQDLVEEQRGEKIERNDALSTIDAWKVKGAVPLSPTEDDRGWDLRQMDGGQAYEEVFSEHDVNGHTPGVAVVYGPTGAMHYEWSRILPDHAEIGPISYIVRISATDPAVKEACAWGGEPYDSIGSRDRYDAARVLKALENWYATTHGREELLRSPGASYSEGLSYEQAKSIWEYRWPMHKGQIR